MTVAKNKKQYKHGKLEDCTMDDTKVKPQTLLKNLQEVESNPKNEESTLVNANIQQSRKSSQNRQEPHIGTHNSTKETAEDNRKKKWCVHHKNIKDRIDTSSEDEEDTSEYDDIEDEVDTGNNENYKDENSIGTKVNSVSNKTESDGLSCDKFAVLHNTSSKSVFIPNCCNDSFELENQVTTRNLVCIEEKEDMTHRPIVSQHYNSSSLASLEGNKFKESVENMDNSSSLVSLEENKFEESEESEESENFRTIFLDNVPIEVDEEIIKELFEPCGHIKHIRIYILKKYYGKKVSKAKRRKLTKVTSITFSTISAAQKAVSKNPLWLNNYYVNIQFFDDAHVNIETFMNNRIFLLNVRHDVTKETLCKLFDDCGEPLYIRYLHEAGTEKFTGIVYVQFRTPEAVRLALQKNDQYWKGARLTITQNLILPENINLSQLFCTSYQGLRAVF